MSIETVWIKCALYTVIKFIKNFLLHVFDNTNALVLLLIMDFYVCMLV